MIDPIPFPCADLQVPLDERSRPQIRVAERLAERLERSEGKPTKLRFAGHLLQRGQEEGDPDDPVVEVD